MKLISCIFSRNIQTNVRAVAITSIWPIIRFYYILRKETNLIIVCKVSNIKQKKHQAHLTDS